MILLTFIRTTKSFITYTDKIVISHSHGMKANFILLTPFVKYILRELICALHLHHSEQNNKDSLK
uniref:Uncharacterized protein n=1 Tax=Trichobilharzia regenti TaxID=157069 RepID=A0AA85JBJ6_TRIRE|nr:unnamed protein product [Trichobilharzia regenti]